MFWHQTGSKALPEPMVTKFTDIYIYIYVSIVFSVQSSIVVLWLLFSLFPTIYKHTCYTLQWRHNDCDGVSNHQPHECLLNRLFGHRWRKTPKLRGTGLCKGNSSVTGEFPAQRASNAENISIWWRHHDNVSRAINCANNIISWRADHRLNSELTSSINRNKHAKLVLFTG